MGGPIKRPKFLRNFAKGDRGAQYFNSTHKEQSPIRERRTSRTLNSSSDTNSSFIETMVHSASCVSGNASLIRTNVPTAAAREYFHFASLSIHGGAPAFDSRVLHTIPSLFASGLTADSLTIETERFLTERKRDARFPPRPGLISLRVHFICSYFQVFEHEKTPIRSGKLSFFFTTDFYEPLHVNTAKI